MPRRPRRNHTPVFKSKVALAAIKGDKTLAELSQQFDVHANQITQWKNQLLERAGVVFESSGCVFHAKPATDSRGSLPLIPGQACHRFHGKPATPGEHRRD